MVLTVGAGNANYGVVMSTTYTGAAGSEEPDGTCIRLYCKDWGHDLKSLDKITPTSGHNILYYPTTKMSLLVELIECLVTAQGAVSASTEWEYVQNFIYTHRIKSGSTKLYLFLYSYVDARYVKLSWNSSHTQVKYVLGYPVPGKWHPKAGTYTCNSLMFEEVP